MELVSIVVPVYNSEKYICRCLESLIKQTYTNIEIILVNDGSKDNSLDMINKHQDRRIRIYNQKNSGPSVARNKGMELANGKYIVFCDSDDYVEDNYVQELLNNLIELDTDIIASGYTDISKYGTVKLNDFYIDKEIISKEIFIDSIFKGVGGTLWGKIFKRDIILKNNIKLNPDIYMCEDMIFVLLYSMHCKSFGVIDKHLYSYNRLNEDSISARVNLSYYRTLINVLEVIEKILIEYGFDTVYVDEILTNRIKNMVITFVIMQNNQKHKYTNKQKIENINIILNNKYTQKYKEQFLYSNKKEKIIMSLIKKKRYFILNCYSFVLYYSQYIKDKLRGIN